MTGASARRETPRATCPAPHAATRMARPDSLIVVVLVTGLVAFGAISTDLYLPSLPAIAAHFGVDAGEAQLTLSVFLIGFALSQLVYGALSDRFGRRPVLLVGLVIYVLASIACMLAPSIGLLIAARLLQAVGACAGVVLGRAVVRDVYGRERAARVLSYVGMAMALAPALGPILGGFIQVWFGWRASFLVLALFGATILAGVFTQLPETNQSRDPTLRLGRQLLNYRSLLQHRAYLGHVLVATCAYSGIFVFISGSSFLLIDVLGLSPEEYGLCFAAIVVGYMLGTLLSGRLTMRLGLERMILIGSLVGLLAGGTAAVLSLAGVVDLLAVLAPFFLFLVGCGLMLPNALAGAMGPFPTMAGAASALLGFIQMVVAAGIGVAVGQLHDETGRGMALALAVVAIGAFLSYRLLIRPSEAKTAKGTA
ncbi:MAG: multidrug effflux MFS transporter [Kiloniellales bacterium]